MAVGEITLSKYNGFSLVKSSFKFSKFSKNANP